MALAVPDQEGAGFREAKAEERARRLEQLARGIDLAYYGKNPSKPRKAKPSGPLGKGCGGDKHVSTHRLLHPELYPKKKNKSGRPAATKVQRTILAAGQSDTSPERQRRDGPVAGAPGLCPRSPHGV